MASPNIHLQSPFISINGQTQESHASFANGRNWHHAVCPFQTSTSNPPSSFINGQPQETVTSSADGRIGILDYGQSKQLPPRDRLALANLIVALVDKDILRISQSMDKLGVKTDTADPAIRAKMGYGMFDTRVK